MYVRDFADKIGASRTDVENWRDRVHLWTEYEPTTPGVAQNYSRENVLEMAVIAAMKKAGCPLRSASAYAGMVIRGHRNGDLRKWLVFPAGDFAQGTGTNDPARVDFADLAGKSPQRAVSLIHVGAIVETVDKLFAEKGES